MAGGITTYAQRKLIDHMISGNARSWTITSPLKLKLFTADPDFDAGTGGTEKTNAGGYTTGGNDVAQGSTNWNAAASQGNGYRWTNKETSAFSWLASADWSNDIVAAAMFDNGGTNMLWGKGLDTDRLVYNGQTIRFAGGAMKLDLDVTVDAGISNLWKQAAFNHLLGLSAYSAPATAYIALFTSNGNFRTGAYAGFTEVAAGDYTRLTVTMNTAWDAADTSGIVDNTADFAWSAATNNWGNIVGAALVGNSSGDWTTNFFAGNSFASTTINTGDTFKILAGDFDVKID